MRRNIILVSLESVRADHCSFMGYTRKTTPTLDEMANKGLYFTNAISSSIPTPASIFSIFTGKYPRANVLDFHPNIWRKEFKKAKTLAEKLSSEGYYTVAFTNNPAVSSLAGFNKGFHQYYDYISNYMSGISIKFSFPLLDNIIRWYKHISAFLAREWIYATWEKIYSQILRQLKEIKKPYFLWIFLLDTHIPYLTPRSSHRWKSPNSMKLLYLSKKISDLSGRPPFSNREKESLINAYDNSIFHIDKFLKILLEETKEDNPIFIIHSDHGEGFGEHGFYEHHVLHLYEELIRVPLVIYNATLKGKVESPVSLISLAPTILELTGIENGFTSKSLLTQRYSPWVVCKVFDQGRRKIAIRMKDWSFIPEQKEEDELYYLKEDPYEQVNVIKEYQRLAEEMRRIKSIIEHESETRKKISRI